MAKKPPPKPVTVPAPKPPNPAARSLADAANRPRVVKPKKGKGSYARKTPPDAPEPGDGGA